MSYPTPTVHCHCGLRLQTRNSQRSNINWGQSKCFYCYIFGAARSGAVIKESRTHSTPKQRAFLHFEVLSVFTGGTRISSAEWSQNMKQIYHTNTAI